MKLLSTLLLSLFLIQSTNTTAQELRLKLPTQDSECRDFNWKNGSDQYKSVEFVYSTEEKVPDAKWNELIMTIMVKAKFGCKNKLTFEPKKLVFITDKNNGGYTASVKRWCSNAYGTPSESTSFYLINTEGDITKEL